MTNREVREWYLDEVAKIAEMDASWKAGGDSLEERALKAWHARHDLRMRAWDMMENPVEADALRARDQLKYGRSDGPTFQDLKEKLLAGGRSVEEALTMILEGARSTSPLFNQLLGIEPPDRPQ